MQGISGGGNRSRDGREYRRASRHTCERDDNGGPRSELDYGKQRCDDGRAERDGGWCIDSWSCGLLGEDTTRRFAFGRDGLDIDDERGGASGVELGRSSSCGDHSSRTNGDDVIDGDAGRRGGEQWVAEQRAGHGDGERNGAGLDRVDMEVLKQSSCGRQPFGVDAVGVIVERVVEAWFRDMASSRDCDDGRIDRRESFGFDDVRRGYIEHGGVHEHGGDRFAECDGGWSCRCRGFRVQCGWACGRQRFSIDAVGVHERDARPIVDWHVAFSAHSVHGWIANRHSFICGDI